MTGLMLAPDGAILSHTDPRKAKWYVQRGLATKKSEDPLVIVLKFEPSGRSNKGADFYEANKDKLCVVCGASENL